MSTRTSELMWAAVQGFPHQIQECPVVKDLFPDTFSPKRVIVCAMGGSAFPADLLSEHITVPMTVHRGYADTLGVIDSDALYICQSFSGNTEEVLSCAKKVLGASAPLLLVCNGGELRSLAERCGVPFVGFPPLPEYFQPRCASGYFLAILAQVFDQVGLSDGLFTTMQSSFEWLSEKWDECKRRALELADAIDDVLLLLGDESIRDNVLRIGRIKLNENAKRMVFVDTLPEFNHNAMEAFAASSQRNSVLLVKSGRTGDQFEKRLETTKIFLSELGWSTAVLTLHGDSEMKKSLYGLWILDIMSLVLADRTGICPMAIDRIESFKKLLASRKD